MQQQLYLEFGIFAEASTQSDLKYLLLTVENLILA